jgi:hypothetical protein
MVKWFKGEIGQWQRGEKMCLKICVIESSLVSKVNYWGKVTVASIFRSVFWSQEENH